MPIPSLSCTPPIDYDFIMDKNTRNTKPQGQLAHDRPPPRPLYALPGNSKLCATRARILFIIPFIYYQHWNSTARIALATSETPPSYSSNRSRYIHFRCHTVGRRSPSLRYVFLIFATEVSPTPVRSIQWTLLIIFSHHSNCFRDYTPVTDTSVLILISEKEMVGLP